MYRGPVGTHAQSQKTVRSLTGIMVPQLHIPRQVTCIGSYHSLLQKSSPILSMAWMPLGFISGMHLLTVLEETKSEEPDHLLNAYRGCLIFYKLCFIHLVYMWHVCMCTHV